MEELRRSLTFYGYNILGSWEDAKDIVQDVFLKFSQVPQDGINDKKSYLIRMVVNLSIDRKRKLKRQLNNYAGPWLPEPVSTDDPHFAVHRKEILSYSMLVLLDKLDATGTPAQNTVTVDFGPVAMTGTPAPAADGTTAGYAPRRFIFFGTTQPA